jgi:hypothetical protein
MPILFFLKHLKHVESGDVTRSMQKSKFNSLDVLDSEIPNLIEKKNIFCWLHPDMYWWNPDFLDCTIKLPISRGEPFAREHLSWFTCLIPNKTQFWSRNLHSNGKIPSFSIFFYGYSMDIPQLHSTTCSRCCSTSTRRLRRSRSRRAMVPACLDSSKRGIWQQIFGT